jgi:hypothetical protein
VDFERKKTSSGGSRKALYLRVMVNVCWTTRTRVEHFVWDLILNWWKNTPKTTHKNTQAAAKVKQWPKATVM